MEVLIYLAIGLYAVLYFAFTLYSLYLVSIGKRNPDQGFLGRVIWYHGIAWIMVMVGTAIVTLSFVFGSFLLAAMQKMIPIGVIK